MNAGKPSREADRPGTFLSIRNITRGGCILIDGRVQLQAMDWNWVYGVALVAANNLVLYVWKPWAGAYSGEKGKNLARKEDLKEILEEVRAVTATQKEIESKISGDLWTKQMVWNQRRDLYGRILDVHSQLTKFVRDWPISDKDDDTKWKEIWAAKEEVFHLISLARIFANERCCETLRQMLLSGDGDWTEFPEIRGDYDVSLREARASIIVAAKEDLGIK